MNCAECIIGSLHLTKNNEGNLNTSELESSSNTEGELESSGNNEGELEIEHIYIKGYKVELNHTYDSLQLATTASTEENVNGIINVNKLITNDFTIESNNMYPSINSEDVYITDGTTIINGIEINLQDNPSFINGNNYRILYRINHNSDDISIIRTNEIIEIYVTFDFHDIEGGFHGMTDVTTGINYLDVNISQSNYSNLGLYKVKLILLNDVANIYNWGTICEVIEQTEITYISQIYSDVYGIPNSTNIPTNIDRLSYTPAFNTYSSEYVMDLYTWIFANMREQINSVTLDEVRVWVKNKNNTIELKNLVVPSTAQIYDTSFISYNSRNIQLPSLENGYKNGIGALTINLNMQGTFDDYDIFLTKQACRRWSTLVTNPEHTIDINVRFEQLDVGILGSANLINWIYQNNLFYATGGSLTLNTYYWEREKNEFKLNHLPFAYYTLLHEIGHVLGIGILWLDNGLISNGSWYTDYRWWDSNYTPALYIGTNAVREYKEYIRLSNPTTDITQIKGIPIEDDGYVGTKGGHLEEGDSSWFDDNGTIQNGHLPRTFGDNIVHPGLDHELMTGWAENNPQPEPLSKITVGMLNDLGFQVDYTKADEYTMT